MDAKYKVRYWFRGQEVVKKLKTKKEVDELVDELHKAAELLGKTKESVKIEIVELP
jgi:hypothetical protein